MIQTLLEETGADLSGVPVNNQDYQIQSRTPELYLGHSRLEYLSSPEKVILDRPITYSKPASLPNSHFAYEGEWQIGSEYAMPFEGSKLYLNFDAKEVFLVVRPKNGGGSFKVLLNESVVTEENKGSDIEDGVVEVNSDQLYKLINIESPGRNELILEFLDDRLELYAFTFG